MRIIVFISSGLGNALQMISFLKQLKSEGAHLTCVFNSLFPCHKLFPGSFIFEKKIIIGRSWLQTIYLIVRYLFHFDVAYLCSHSFAWQTFLISRFCARKIVTSYPIDILTKRLPFNQWPRFIHTGVQLRSPERGVHEITQFMRLIHNNFKDIEISEKFHFLPNNLLSETEKSFIFQKFSLERIKSYIILEISSANNTAPQKNWPIKYWIEWLKLVQKKYPKLQFVMIGDQHESDLANEILNCNFSNVISTVGNTTIEELIRLIEYCDFFVGLDGGPRHLAFCLNKPTFTIWGGSDFNLYGYERINQIRHRDVFLKTNCRPCDFHLINNIRVYNPIKCNHHKCLIELKPRFIFEQFINYYENLKNHYSFVNH